MTTDTPTWGELTEQAADFRRRTDDLKRISDYETVKRELAEVREQLKASNLWDDPDKARELGKRESRLAVTLGELDAISEQVADLLGLIELGRDEKDESMQTELAADMGKLLKKLEKTEFRSVFSGEHDAGNTFLEIQAGSGGTEAQDWAEMLLRMYLRWCERRGFATEMLEYSPGEVAGIKGASVLCRGDHAYGWLRTESGIHRLVRKSPFDSGNRRHTSFASVFVTPEIDDNIEIHINPKDLRVDTYRASGAGGQHVNKTDSAVRITHIPSGLVAQCQSQRSQHQNRENAMRQLRAKLWHIEVEKLSGAKRELEASKDDISWGYQIRSYVLDASRIKDLRTGIEVSDCNRVLDGDLDVFIEAGLRHSGEQRHT